MYFGACELFFYLCHAICFMCILYVSMLILSVKLLRLKTCDICVCLLYSNFYCYNLQSRPWLTIVVCDLLYSLLNEFFLLFLTTQRTHQDIHKCGVLH